MKRTTLVVTILLLLAAPLTLLVWGFALPAQYEDTFLGELGAKCQRLEETESPRLVLVGGSSVAFGVDSGLLEQELEDYTSVNFGLYAALGTKVMLDLSEDSIRSGDIVILMPEQQEQTLSCYLNGEFLWQGLDGHFALLTRLDEADWGQMIGTFPAFAAQKFGYWLRGHSLHDFGVYSRSSFDDYGDLVAADCTANIMAGGYDPNTPILLEEGVCSADFIDYMNQYIDTLTARGATVYYHFSPMNALALTEGSDGDRYYDWLQGQLHCPILGDPQDSVLEAGWFYDTNFHLNASGKTVFTRQLIRDLKAQLGDSSPTQIDLPDCPALADPQTGAATESGDADCFLWSSDGSSVTLTGLTEAGQGRTELTLPATLDGEPVAVLAASCFAGNTTIQRITIPATLSTIEDGAFSGCTALTALVLEQSQPEACRVGQGLLEGTDALIYVPEEALSAYRLNYFWSGYASRIRAAQVQQDAG